MQYRQLQALQPKTEQTAVDSEHEEGLWCEGLWCECLTCRRSRPTCGCGACRICCGWV